MPQSKKRKNARKVEKKYSFVTFTSDLFEDEFTLPDQDHFNLKLIGDINEGNMGALLVWLRKAGVEEDQIEAIGTLESHEVEGFLSAWGEGSVTSFPK